MSNSPQRIFAITALCFLSSCATFISGTRQHILVNTYPAHADIYHEGEYKGTTPKVAEIRRKTREPLILKSEGYVAKEVYLKKKLNLNAVFNCVNIYGWLIDWLTGSIYSFSENSCVQNLIAEKEQNVIIPVARLDSVVSSDSILFWNANYKLRYADFEGGRSNDYRLFAAGICSFIVCNYVLTDTSAVVRVLNCFYKKYSFFSSRKRQQEKVLSHEQQHYDITEIISRKLRQQLKKKEFKKEGFEKELNSIVFSSFIDLYAMQANYDHEVYNGSNIFEENIQAHWNNKVAQQLNELNDFKECDIEIRLTDTN